MRARHCNTIVRELDCGWSAAEYGVRGCADARVIHSRASRAYIYAEIKSRFLALFSVTVKSHVFAEVRLATAVPHPEKLHWGGRCKAIGIAHYDQTIRGYIVGRLNIEVIIRN
jgi:hypothetical protein